jgi:cobalt-zinc-cadmium efflux system outer membrane protein
MVDSQRGALAPHRAAPYAAASFTAALLWAAIPDSAWPQAAATGALDATAAGATPAPAEEELRLPEVLRRVALRSPELRSAALELRAADARVLQARARPAPEISFEVENAFGSGAFSGTRRAEWTLGLVQPIELGDKRARRIDVAGGERALSEIDYARRRIDVLADAAQRFLAVVEQQAVMEVLARVSALARAAVEPAAARVRAGRSSEAELRRARIALTESEIAAARAVAHVESARHELASSWGADSPDFGLVRAALFELDPIPAPDEMRERLAAAPALQRAAALRALRRAERELAQAQARPDLRLGLGVRRFEELDDQGIVASVSLNLPQRQAREGRLLESEARAEQADVDVEAATLRANVALSNTRRELEALRGEVGRLRAEVIPDAGAAVETLQRGYELGRFSFIELAAARQELLVAERRAIALAAEYQRARIELERIGGTLALDYATPGRPGSER